MADEEITIRVTTEVDDEAVTSLQEALEEIAELANIQIEVSADSSELDDVQDKIDDIDGFIIGGDVDVDSSSVDELNEKLDESVDKSSDLGATVSGLAATLAIDEMANTADNVNNSWNQLSLTFKGTGVSVDTLKVKTNELSQATGRSGSQIRTYFNQMGIAGVTNVNLLSESFENLTGRSYQTGRSVEQMEGSVQKMVMTGNAGGKMLTNLGISTTDLGKAMGVTKDEAQDAFKNLSETERLEVLNKAMGDGTKANEMYKNSYKGMKEQAQIAFAGLMAAIGQSILPVVIPAIKALASGIKTLSDVFKALPAPVTSALGAVLAIISGLAFLGGVIGIATKALRFMWSGLQTLGGHIIGAVNKIRNLGTTLRTLKANVVQAATTIKSNMMSALSSLKSAIVGAITRVKELGMAFLTQAKQILVSVYAWIAEKVQIVVSTIVKYANMVATYALAAAEFLLASPILIVIAVVIAVIAIFWYLYNTNASVRAGINWLIGVLQQLASIIIGAVKSALTNIINGFNNVKSVLQPLASALSGTLTSAWNTMKNAVNNAISPIKSVYDNLKKIYDFIVNNGKAVGDFLGGIGGAIGLGGADIKQSVGWASNLSTPTGNSGRLISTSKAVTTNNQEGNKEISIDTVNINNDDDMDSFVKKLNHALYWSNSTGSRSV